MEMTDTVYKRNFSHLGTFQQQKELTYSLIVTEGKPERYGVCIAECANNKVRSEKFTNITRCRKNAEQVLAFLYENGITPTILPDILHDLAVQGALRQGESSEEI